MAELKRFRLLAPAALACVMLATGAAAKGFTDVDQTKIPYRTVPGASPEPLPTAGITSPQELEAFVDGFVTEARLVNKTAGVTVAIVKDGQLYFAKGYGKADIARDIPVDPAKTLFRPGSTSKLFTWTAVMQLVEQGKLDLDADVNKYITQFQIPATFKEPITLRNIMTHSAGFEDGGVGYLMAKTPEGLVPLADALKNHVPERVRPVANATSPITSSYSNWSTALAGLIVANVSGEKYEDYIANHILKPLQMTSSTFVEPLPKDLAARMSVGYLEKDGVLKPRAFEYISSFGPAGALSATATDMANFMIAHLQNGRFGDVQILKPETAELMHSRMFSPNPYVNGSGFGIYETYINGRRLIGHGGDTVYFHTELMLLKEQNIGIFMSVNTAGGAAIPRNFLKAFMDHYYPAKLPQVKAPADFAKRAADYAGAYRITRHNYSKNEAVITGLTSEASIVPTKDGTLMMAGMSEKPVQYVEIAPSVFRQVDGEDVIAFSRDSSGKVTGFSYNFAFMPFYKLTLTQTKGFNFTVVGLSLLLFVTAIVAAFRNWKTDRSAPKTARLARWNLAAIGILHITFLVSVIALLTAGLEDLIAQLPPGLHTALILPIIAAVLTVIAVVLAVFVWKDKAWTRSGRILHTAGVIAAIAMLWFLNSWNLLGYHFG